MDNRRRSVGLWAVCHTCRHKHSLHNEAQGAMGYWVDWLAKHPECDVGLVSETDSWKGFKDNADVKDAYVASVAYTITLASLATDTNVIAGRESTAISNTSNKYGDYLVGGKISTGTSPTAGRIEVWAYGAVNDTPLYPDAITGSDSNRSATTADIKVSSMRPLASMSTDSTSNRAYWFGPMNIAPLFGGRMPTAHGVWAVHNTAVNLNSTGGNHALYYTGLYNTVI